MPSNGFTPGTTPLSAELSGAFVTERPAHTVDLLDYAELTVELEVGEIFGADIGSAWLAHADGAPGATLTHAVLFVADPDASDLMRARGPDRAAAAG